MWVNVLKTIAQILVFGAIEILGLFVIVFGTYDYKFKMQIEAWLTLFVILMALETWLLIVLSLKFNKKFGFVELLIIAGNIFLSFKFIESGYK